MSDNFKPSPYQPPQSGTANPFGTHTSSSAISTAFHHLPPLQLQSPPLSPWSAFPLNLTIPLIIWAPYHKCHFDTKAFDNIHVKLAVKCLEKSMVYIPHRKAPLTPSVLLQFNAHLDLRDSAHLASWSACLGWLLHILSHSFSFFLTFSSRNILSRSSITFNSSGALITITWTKTRQAGDAAPVVPFPRISGSPLCPTFALHSLLRTVPAPDTHSLFSFISHSNQLACITSKSLDDGIKHLAVLISLDPWDYSSTLRRLEIGSLLIVFIFAFGRAPCALEHYLRVRPTFAARSNYRAYFKTFLYFRFLFHLLALVLSPRTSLPSTANLVWASLTLLGGFTRALRGSSFLIEDTQTDSLSRFLVVSCECHPVLFCTSIGKGKEGWGDEKGREIIPVVARQIYIFETLTRGKRLKHQILNSIRWPNHVINSVNNSKFPCYILPQTQHHSFFRNLPS